ncbi:MAG: hypothetical protein LCH61_20480, partial [Proteobacteria bacterium]|nr:hypothetical protein [Pseudomonadota bacterium]
ALHSVASLGRNRGEAQVGNQRTVGDHLRHWTLLLNNPDQGLFSLRVLRDITYLFFLLKREFFMLSIPMVDGRGFHASAGY